MHIDKSIEYSCNGYIYKNFVNLTSAEIKQVFEWRNHSAIRKYMYNPHIISYQSHINFIQSLERRNDVSYWLVYKNMKPMGVVNLTSIDFNEKSAELGFYMVPDVLNSGLGLDFAYANFCFAFNIVGCDLIVGGIHPENKNAILLDRYLGAVFGKTITRDIDGEIVDFISWTLYRDDFIRDFSNKNDIRVFVKYLRDNQEC